MFYRVIALIFANLLFMRCASSQEWQPITQMELVPPANQTGFANRDNSDLWRSTPSANYHLAAVRVSCDQTRAAGSGANVLVDGNGTFVLTNHHVIEGTQTATVRSLDGLALRMQVIYADRDVDLAILYSPQRVFSTALPIYEGEVPLGADVELLGYGGPDPILRHVLGKKVNHRYGYKLSIDTYTVSGDSGGAMVYGGGIAGVNFGGPADKQWGSVRTASGNWRLTRPASSQCDGFILKRILTQICQRYRCQPRCISQPKQTSPPVSQPVPTPGLRCEKGEKGDPGERGPAGPAGPQGPAGKDGLSGIQKLRISSSGNLIAIYANGREEVVGNVASNGISYYEIVKKED